MKKIALFVTSSLFVAGTALACPGMDHDAPKTAEKAKPVEKKAEEPKTKAPEADKKAPEKTAKPETKTPEKKADKVSSR